MPGYARNPDAIADDVLVFASTAARNSSLPSPTTGVITYIQDIDRLEYYNSLVFKPVGSGENTVAPSSNYSADPSDLVVADTSLGSITVTLPADPSLGDRITIVDAKNTFSTNPVLIDPLTKKINSYSEQLSLNVLGATVVLLYVSDIIGWKVI